MLGSKLIDTSSDKDDQVVWGCAEDAFITDERLNYYNYPDLAAAPLLGPHSPPNDCAFDVYEKFFQVMTSSILSKEPLAKF